MVIACYLHWGVVLWVLSRESLGSGPLGVDSFAADKVAASIFFMTTNTALIQ